MNISMRTGTFFGCCALLAAAIYACGGDNASGPSVGGSGGRAGSGGGGGSGSSGSDATAGQSGSGMGGTAEGGSGGTGGAGIAGSLPDASIDSGELRDAVSDVGSKGDDAAAPPSDGAAPCGSPPSGLYAAFRVAAKEVFYVWITNSTGITEALALWRGQSMARIPTGKLDCTSGTYNCGWTWHLKPDTIRFAEITIEICDGRPSYVEAHCSTFADGTYCPWGTELIGLRDCRTDVRCPALPR